MSVLAALTWAASGLPKSITALAETFQQWTTGATAAINDNSQRTEVLEDALDALSARVTQLAADADKRDTDSVNSIDALTARNLALQSGVDATTAELHQLKSQVRRLLQGPEPRPLVPPFPAFTAVAANPAGVSDAQLREQLRVEIPPTKDIARVLINESTGTLDCASIIRVLRLVVAFADRNGGKLPFGLVEHIPPEPRERLHAFVRANVRDGGELEMPGDAIAWYNTLVKYIQLNGPVLSEAVRTLDYMAVPSIVQSPTLRKTDVQLALTVMLQNAQRTITACNEASRSLPSARRIVWAALRLRVPVAVAQRALHLAGLSAEDAPPLDADFEAMAAHLQTATEEVWNEATEDSTTRSVFKPREKDGKTPADTPTPASGAGGGGSGSGGSTAAPKGVVKLTAPASSPATASGGGGKPAARVEARAGAGSPHGPSTVGARDAPIAPREPPATGCWNCQPSTAAPHNRHACPKPCRWYKDGDKASCKSGMGCPHGPFVPGLHGRARDRA